MTLEKTIEVVGDLVVEIGETAPCITPLAETVEKIVKFRLNQPDKDPFYAVNASMSKKVTTVIDLCPKAVVHFGVGETGLALADRNLQTTKKI